MFKIYNVSHCAVVPALPLKLNCKEPDVCLYATFTLLSSLHENSFLLYIIFVYLGYQTPLEEYSHFTCTGFGTCFYLYLITGSSFANLHAEYIFMHKNL